MVLRLKCWVLIHILLSDSIGDETAHKIEELIEYHDEQIEKKLLDFALNEKDRYFIKEV